MSKYAVYDTRHFSYKSCIIQLFISWKQKKWKLPSSVQNRVKISPTWTTQKKLKCTKYSNANKKNDSERAKQTNIINNDKTYHGTVSSFSDSIKCFGVVVQHRRPHRRYMISWWVSMYMLNAVVVIWCKHISYLMNYKKSRVWKTFLIDKINWPVPFFSLGI